MGDVYFLKVLQFLFEFLDIIFKSVDFLVFRGEGFGDVVERCGHAFGRGRALPNFDVLFDLVDWRHGVGDYASVSDVWTGGFHGTLVHFTILTLHLLV